MIRRFNIYKFSEVLKFINMEKVVSNGDDFVVDALFYFKPVQRFKHRGNLFSFEGSSYCASKIILQ